MFRPRIIPVLLLKGQGLVKSKRFKDYHYIGDPINAVKIFNDCWADELVFLDILATQQKRLISIDFVRNVGEEANMPFAVGGGIRTLADIRSVIAAGAEKVIINTAALENPDFIKQASDEFGSSTICVCIDCKKKFFGGTQILYRGQKKIPQYVPKEFAELMQEKGAGELILQSVDRDGQMQGYDFEFIKSIAQSLTIPVIALGGAGSLEDLKRVYTECGVSGLAAGSLFVYHGINRGVLINYPNKEQIKNLFYEE